MKKKIFSGVFALALLLIAGYGVNRSMNSYADLSDLALKNVLALANIENPDPGESGGDQTLYQTMKYCDGVLKRACTTTVYAYLCSYDCP